MGSGQSLLGDANISAVPSSSTADKKKSSFFQKEILDDDDGEVPKRRKDKTLETPIVMEDDDEDDVSGKPGESSFPTPTGREYDLMDRIAADLPAIIDDESKQQVDDYIEACDDGKGPMVACFSMAEFESLFLRKHKEASELYDNTCFRPKSDKSPMSVLVDGTKAYGPACFNLAQMRMTGKGGTKFSRKDGYDLFDRACRTGHGGACHMQAKMLASYPGSLGKDVPYNPKKAAALFEETCTEGGDSISCFTLATMLLRGNLVSTEADNVTPQEAVGTAPIKQRKNEADRIKITEDKRIALERDPMRAEQLLLSGCERGHAPSCYNLAVMYTQGDVGIPQDQLKADEFQKKTEEMVERYGGFGFGGST